MGPAVQFGCRRTGTSYILVLFTTTIVATIGFGAIMAVRAQSRMTSNTRDLQEARGYALSALEFGQWRIASDAQWRTTYSNGDWCTNQAIGNPTGSPASAGTFTLNVVNPNGALNNDETDPVVMTATGRKGLATQKVQLTLIAQKVPLTCLNASLVSGSSLNLGSAQITAYNQILATNGSGIAFGGTVNAHVEAVGTLWGWQFNQTTKQGVKPRTLPDSTVFDYYQTNGTAISITDLPFVSGDRSIANTVLSPNNNPFGSRATNSEGIYVIDCQGLTIRIESARVVGTLVLLNVGSGSVVRTAVNMVPAISNYPTLLVQGSLTIQFDSDPLTESSAGNLNPTGSSPPTTATPYPWSTGSYDGDTADEYPSEIKGLVYVSGNLSFGSSPTVGPVVAGGNVWTGGSPTFTYDSQYLENAPPGFYTVQMVPATNGYRQVVDGM